MNNNISRRRFFKILGSTATAVGLSLVGCKSDDKTAKPDDYKNQAAPPKGKMTYRLNHNSGDKVSILGYGMMRLPMKGDVNGPSQDGEIAIDQDMVNRLVDYAIEHGVNYFDTSPAYCQGKSEGSTGQALSRHKRDKYFIATKLSNFAPATWSREESMKIYKKSFRELQTDYIDYYLLHAIGMGEDGMDEMQKRYFDNGMLDFLLEERQKGKIRNLGFSYHGDIGCFDYLLARHDKYKWDFVQIELNYLDWNFADEINARNTDAVYLYRELEKRNIPAVIMEPLLGGRLAKMPHSIMRSLKELNQQASVASWAFRYAGTPKGVLTVLSGMTYMEHLKDNLLSMCPLKPLSDSEMRFLDRDVASQIVDYKLIPCNDCKYCMPCPYGIDIPGVFLHYNRCQNESNVPRSKQDANYKSARRAFLIGYDRSVPRMRQADHCTGCGKCLRECPQRIAIPQEMERISKYTDQLKQGTLDV